MSDILRAITMTQDKARPSLYKVKKCFIMKHHNLKEEVWNTKIVIRLKLEDNTIKEVMTMYSEKFEVPYIPNINRGDVVSLQHRKLLSAHEVVSIWAKTPRSGYEEVRRNIE
jgi:hypothetical protein